MERKVRSLERAPHWFPHRSVVHQPACLELALLDPQVGGRGLDIAREHGVADLDENEEWVVGYCTDATPNVA